MGIYMIFESLDYFILESLIILLIGAAGGTFAQAVSLRLKYNGKWDTISTGRKISLLFTGTLASLIVGLYFLDTEYAQGKSLAAIIWRLWAYQLTAGWSGGIAMSWLEQRLFNNNQRDGNSVINSALLPDKTLEGGHGTSTLEELDDSDG